MRELIKVTWLDAQDGPDKWTREEDAVAFGNAVCEILSVGFVVSKTDKYLTIAGDWDESDKDYGRVTKIPVAMVLNIEEVG